MLKPWVLATVSLGLAAGTPLAAAAATPQEIIRDCVRHAKPEQIGLDELRVDCPTLESALQRAGLAAHLPDDWKEQVTQVDLADWGALADRYDPTVAASVRHLDGANLQIIARHLQPPPQLPNWWERLKTWMAGWLDSSQGRWPRWLHWPDQWHPGKYVLYGVMALVLIAAAVVVALELRAAGVLGSGRRRTLIQRAAGGATTLGQDPEEVDEPLEQLRAERVLRLLVTALTKANRLDRNRDLTCRELIVAARFDTNQQREVFAKIALRAEQILYGEPARAPAPDDPEMGQSVRTLYTQLRSTPFGQPSK